MLFDCSLSRVFETLTILVAELVGCPDTALASLAVDSIDKAVTLRLGSIIAIILRIAQQSRRHTRPKRKNHKSNQVAHGHSPPSGLVQSRSSGNITLPDSAGQNAALARGGEVVQGDEEENGTGDVDEGVYAVDPVQKEGARQEPSLEGQFPEDVQVLLEVDELQSVFAGHVDGSFDESQGCEGSAYLIDLNTR